MALGSKLSIVRTAGERADGPHTWIVELGLRLSEPARNSRPPGCMLCQSNLFVAQPGDLNKVHAAYERSMNKHLIYDKSIIFRVYMAIQKDVQGRMSRSQWILLVCTLLFRRSSRTPPTETQVKPQALTRKANKDLLFVTPPKTSWR